ncbi:MAG: TonB-dependent receptor [Proteobacteria bacterium]|nr:TonB-dependent receptor [Pseudomonadota bacterium]
MNCNLGGSGGPYWCGQLPTTSGLSPAQYGTYAILDPNTYSVFEDNVDKVPEPFSSTWLDHYGVKRRMNYVLAKADYRTDSGWQASLFGGYSSTERAVMIGREGFDTSATTNPFRPSRAALAADCAASPLTFQFNACYAPKTQQLSAYTMDVHNDYNAELRLSTPTDRRLRATVGASYFGDDVPLSSGIILADIGIIPALGASDSSSVSTPAVFGGAYYDLTDKVTLSAETRYQWDRITEQQIFPTIGTSLSHVFTSFSPRVSLAYNPTPSQLLYATYSVGYKPGKFNADLVGQPASVLGQLPAGTGIPYQQEKLNNYEVGSKGMWLDDRLQTTLALYYMKWSQGQVSNL